jgi:hypothetical protein
MVFVKPNGTEIEVRDDEDVIAYCKSLGWKEKIVRRKKATKSQDELTD